MESVKRTNTFWNFFTLPRFRHIVLLFPAFYPSPGPMADRHTVKVDPMAWGIQTEAIWEDPDVVAADYLKAGATAAVLWTALIPPYPVQYVPRGLWSCVTAVKSLLGIRAWNVWTPWALFVYLLCRGGKIVTTSGGADA